MRSGISSCLPKSLGAAFLATAFVLVNAMADNVDVNPPSGIGNTPVTVTISGFDPNNSGTCSANIYLNGQYWGSCSSPGSSAQLQRDMPAYPPGDYFVEAKGPYPSYASKHFTVISPSFMIDHPCITNGMSLILAGYNFPASASVPVWLDNGSNQPSVVVTDTNGVFAKSISFGAPTGAHTVSARDGTVVLTQNFVVGSNVCSQVGQILGMAGQTTVSRNGGPPQPLNPNDPILMGDVIETAKDGPVSLFLLDGTTFTLAPNSRLPIDEYFYDPNSNDGSAQYSLVRGAMEYISGLMAKHDDNVVVKLVYGALGIRGTKFIAQIDPCSLNETIYLIDGELAVTPLNGGITNIVDAPATIGLSANIVSTNVLTQATYDAMEALINQTNATFASWQVQYFGCTNNPAAAPGADPDGDGANNLAEYLAGTNPTNSASVFHILSANPAGNDLLVTWLCGGGRTNVLQATTNLSGPWLNISSNIVLLGTDDVTTNFLDLGGVTNASAKFYRVQLVQ